MEQLLSQQLAESIAKGNAVEFFGYVLIFVFIWFEVRGMKTEIKNLNDTVKRSFADGEKRFIKLEENQKTYEHRLTMLEKTKGGY